VGVLSRRLRGVWLVAIVGVVVVVVVILGPGGPGAVTKTNTTTTTRTTTTGTTTTTTWPKPSSQNPIRGICYAPLPCTANCRKGTGTPEDMTEPGYANMWDASGRGDFGIIKAMGANTIRVYHPMGEEIRFSQPKTEPDRTQFLAAVKSSGLNVLGAVDQSLPCPNDDCYASWYRAVTLGLASGFAVQNAWHETVWAVNMINEVDGMTTRSDGTQDPAVYMKRLVSAIDGLLAAERDAKVTANLVNLTSCFTTALAAPLGGGLASIFHGFSSMEAWIKNPHLLSYRPRVVTSLTDLAARVGGRWLHCMNAQIPWNGIIKLIPQDYTKVGMGRRPWFLGEMGFNGNHGDQITRDLKQMQTYALEGNTTFFGTLFFQFQTAYWKTGSELNFGMFGLADKLGYSATIAATPWQKQKEEPLRCLTSKLWVYEGGATSKTCGGHTTLCNHRAQAVAAAWKGSLVGKGLCLNAAPIGPGTIVSEVVDA